MFKNGAHVNNKLMADHLQKQFARKKIVHSMLKEITYAKLCPGIWAYDFHM